MATHTHTEASQRSTESLLSSRPLTPYRRRERGRKGERGGGGGRDSVRITILLILAVVNLCIPSDSIHMIYCVNTVLCSYFTHYADSANNVHTVLISTQYSTSQTIMECSKIYDSQQMTEDR